MKKWLPFALLTVACCMLTGCWNYREIDSLSIVAGVAIERDSESGDYILYIEIIEPGGDSKEQSTKSKIVESRGKTMFDATRNAIDTSGKRLFWNHAQVVIMSEEVAQMGILDVIDWLYRDAELRLTLCPLVANGVSAKDIINTDGITDEIRSLEIYNKLKNADGVETYPRVELYQLIETLKSDAPYAYAPSITIEKQGDMQVSEVAGIAIFKGDKLQGFLNSDDTKYFLYAIDEIQGGLLTCDNVQGIPDSNVSLEVFDNKTTVKPIYSNGIITMKIKIETEVAIGESGSSVDYKDKAGMTSLKDDAQEFLVQNVMRVIRKVQDEFDTDIFGFGQRIYENMPDVWKQYEDSWDIGFQELEFDISSEIKIRNTAQSGKSLEGAK